MPTAAEKRAAAIARAKESMKADKAKVQATLSKKRQREEDDNEEEGGTDTRTSTGTPAKRIKSEAPRSAKKEVVSSVATTSSKKKAAVPKEATAKPKPARAPVATVVASPARAPIPAATTPDATAAAYLQQQQQLQLAQLLYNQQQQQQQQYASMYGPYGAATQMPGYGGYSSQQQPVPNSWTGYGAPQFGSPTGTAGTTVPFYQPPSYSYPPVPSAPPMTNIASSAVAPSSAKKPPAKSSATPSAATKKKAPTPKKASLPPPKKKDESEDDEPIPPPPVQTLQMQISQQVLANASASMNNQPFPHMVAPPQAYQHTLENSSATSLEDEQSYEPDDQPIYVDDYPSADIPKKKYGGRSCVVWMIVIVALALGISAMFAHDHAAKKRSPVTVVTTKMSSPSSTALEVPCFFDSEPRYTTIEEEEVGEDGERTMTTRRVLLRPCQGADNASPCPTHAVCQDGKLVECTDKSFEIDPLGAGCELTSATMDVVALWASVLEERSIQELCASQSSSGSTTALPVFDYKELQLLYPDTLATHPLDIQILSTHFLVEHEDGRYFIGLPDGHALVLPFRCRAVAFVSATTKWTLALFGDITWTIARYTTKFLWSLTSAYPLVTLILCLIVFIVRKVLLFQEHRAKLARDVPTMRDKAFGELQENSDVAHAALHLRDALVAELTAHDNMIHVKRQRQYWIEQVWPRVVPQLYQDNRIKKTQRVEAGTGKRRDYYQWVAVKRSIAKKRVSIQEGAEPEKKKDQ